MANANCCCSALSRSWECVHAPQCPVNGCTGETFSVYEEGSGRMYMVPNFGAMGNLSMATDDYVGGHCSVHGEFEDEKFAAACAALMELDRRENIARMKAMGVHCCPSCSDD